MEKIIIDGKEFRAEKGTVLSRVLQQECPEFAFPCGGSGRCGKCKVKAAGSLSSPGETERSFLSEKELAEGVRLACYTKVEGSCFVWLPGKSESVIMQTGECENTESGEGETANPLFSNIGVAVDIGTTTMAACLYTQEGMKAQTGIENPQLGFGADVISRIEKSMAGYAEQLAQSVRGGIQELLICLCEQAGCQVSSVDTIVITGNTAMLYLLTQRNPEPLSKAPFQADWLGDVWLKGEDLDLSCEEANVYLPPCIGAFVGADIVTAILASGLCKGAENKLLVDIGTNGEVALWKDQKLYCCSTAAGPAFEGTGLSMGMQGKKGAVSHVRLTENRGTGQPALQAEVIGGGEPVGICGSGVIDAVSCLLKTGRLDETGYLEEEEAVIAGAVAINQQDIRKVQLAKSAVCAGIKTILHHAGMEPEDLERLLAAGGFGSYLDISSAIYVGLLPEISTEKIKVCGNAALAGASGLLKSKAALDAARQIAASAEVTELASDPYFQVNYIEGMMF